MRDYPAFVPELNIIAVENGRIIGSSICLTSYIDGDDGKRHEVLNPCPIGVLPEYQRMGISGMLIPRTKEIARVISFGKILLCEDPDYPIRQGFFPAEKFRICNSENIYAEALHACELYQWAFSEMRGTYHEDAIYNVDENSAKAFDKQFPSKEIIYGTPMQKKFEIMVGRMNPYQTQC